MAINKEFEAYKVKRELKRSGIDYEFKRQKSNKYGEPIPDESEVVGTVRGLYHEESMHVSIQTGDTTQYRSKKVPNILCLYEDTAFLQVGDKVSMNGKVMEVTGITNIQEWSIIADISLEVVDNNVVQNRLQGEHTE